MRWLHLGQALRRHLGVRGTHIMVTYYVGAFRYGLLTTRGDELSETAGRRLPRRRKPELSFPYMEAILAVMNTT